MGRKIGIVVADVDEYLPLLKLVDAKEFKWYKRDGIAFNINGSEILCLNCGIGKVNAATAATYLIENGCEIILNYGLSGGISRVRRGEMSIVDKFLEHDFDLTGIGYKPCEKPRQEYVYSADGKLLEIFKGVLPDAVIGTAVSGDRFISSETDREYFKENFSAVSCDMETGAIASVCYFAGVPFIALRRISDDAGSDAFEDYNEMNTSNENLMFERFLLCLKAVTERY